MGVDLGAHFRRDIFVRDAFTAIKFRHASLDVGEPAAFVKEVSLECRTGNPGARAIHRIGQPIDLVGGLLVNADCDRGHAAFAFICSR